MSMSASEAQSITGLVARIVRPSGDSISPALRAIGDQFRFQLVSKVETAHVPDPRYASHANNAHTIEHRVEHIVVAGPSFDDCVEAWRKLNGHGQRRNGGRA